MFIVEEKTERTERIRKPRTPRTKVPRAYEWQDVAKAKG